MAEKMYIARNPRKIWDKKTATYSTVEPKEFVINSSRHAPVCVYKTPKYAIRYSCDVGSKDFNGEVKELNADYLPTVDENGNIDFAEAERLMLFWGQMADGLKR